MHNKSTLLQSTRVNHYEFVTVYLCILQFVVCVKLSYHSHILNCLDRGKYRIVGNFGGRELSQIGKK